MPQPLKFVNDKAKFKLTTDALVNRPELANLVTQVFGVWALIETEMRTLFVRIVSPEDSTAVAVYNILESDSLRRKALLKAAEAKFGAGSEAFELFYCVDRVVHQTGAIRHNLAHRRWGISPDLPDALLIADPSILYKHRIAYHRLSDMMREANVKDGFESLFDDMQLDRSKILVYRVAELESALDEMDQALRAVLLFGQYIAPTMTDEQGQRISQDVGNPEWDDLATRAGALRQLSSLSLFQAARDRFAQDKSKNPKTPP